MWMVADFLKVKLGSALVSLYRFKPKLSTSSCTVRGWVQLAPGRGPGTEGGYGGEESHLTGGCASEKRAFPTPSRQCCEQGRVAEPNPAAANGSAQLSSPVRTSGQKL